MSNTPRPSYIPVSTRAAATALYELDLLIDETADEQPDPLTDAVFRARDELRRSLNAHYE